MEDKRVLVVTDCDGCGHYDKECGDCSELGRVVNGNGIDPKCPLKGIAKFITDQVVDFLDRNYKIHNW